MVEEDPRKISLWFFKWLKIGLDGLTVPFDTMYIIPILFGHTKRVPIHGM